MAGLINFEDENEVKQFLDNLGVEYSFQCYKEKQPEGICALHSFSAEWHIFCKNMLMSLYHDG